MTDTQNPHPLGLTPEEIALSYTTKDATLVRYGAQNSGGVPPPQLYKLKNNSAWGEITFHNPSRELLRITKDGDVLADSLENASEAGKVFVESIRFNLRRITELEAHIAAEPERMRAVVERCASIVTNSSSIGSAILTIRAIAAQGS